MKKKASRKKPTPILSKVVKQQVSVLLLMAYSDELFLELFRSKKESYYTFIGGEAAINIVLERLKKLDPKLYEQLYGKKV